MGIELYMQKHDGVMRKFKPKDFSISFSEITDRMDCRKMDLEVSRTIPIGQFDIITAINNGNPLFRGYVNRYEIDSNRDKSLTVNGMEDLLNMRYMPCYFYPKSSITFSEFFADTLETYIQPPTIACANSATPPGIDYTYYNEALNIIRLTGCGTASRFGENRIFHVMYQEVREVFERDSLLALTTADSSYYRNDDDLYIRISGPSSRSWADLGGLLIENCFDTTVRIGEIDTPDQTLSSAMLTNLDPIGDLIAETVRANGQYIHVRDTTRYTYLDITETQEPP